MLYYVTPFKESEHVIRQLDKQMELIPKSTLAVGVTRLAGSLSTQSSEQSLDPPAGIRRP